MSRALDRNPTAATAAEGFAGHIFGVLLVMVSVFVMIAGLAMLVEMARRVVGRVSAAGVGFVLGGAAVFGGGRWLMDRGSSAAPTPAELNEGRPTRFAQAGSACSRGQSALALGQAAPLRNGTDSLADVLGIGSRQLLRSLLRRDERR